VLGGGRRWSAWICAAAFFLLGAFPLYNIDAYGHLAQGRQIEALGRVPTLDPFSFWKSTPQPWSNYEWAYDLFTWLIYDRYGPNALIVIKCVLLAALGYLLVVLGLLISVPIIVWGSTIMLRWVERYPGIVYVGAGVLAWTAAKMIISEPYLKAAFGTNGAAAALVYFALIGGVLWAGFVKNHRKLESRISARLEVLAHQLEAERNGVAASEGVNAMARVLVPVDGSRNSEYALRHVVREFQQRPGLEVHLLNVQPPLSRHIAQFIGRKTRDSFHHDEAEKALRPARQLVESFGVPYSAHVRVGSKGTAIVEEARRLGCDRIVMSTARKNSLTRMLEDSTTNKVLEQTSVPVEVIAGESVSKLERFGLAAGLGAAIALLIAAATD